MPACGGIKVAGTARTRIRQTKFRESGKVLKNIGITTFNNTTKNNIATKNIFSKLIVLILKNIGITTLTT